eukprot:GHVP01031542.1.p1 GENE.GHVP01031542.1~~GHVP01031542.1.p1  ORF type:complete len:211 (-),score=35.95 GHVP01031542.1:857-1489(-)
MASLYPKKRDIYYDKKLCESLEEWKKLLEVSTSVYVGNLAFYTSEDQIFELFSRVGYVRSVIIGLNKQKQSAGFAFVTFGSHEEAELASRLLDQAGLDNRQIRVDMDSGVELERRKEGRGYGGQQWRDVFRKGYDSGRGEGGGRDVNERTKRKREEGRWSEHPNENNDRQHEREIQHHERFHGRTYERPPRNSWPTGGGNRKFQKQGSRH